MEFFNVQVTNQAIQRATQTLESGWLSEGQRVAEFEQALEDRLGLVNPVTVNSGTSALVLALALAGVEYGDEVLIPAQTFVATGLAPLQLGADITFVDIDPLTGNMSVDDLRKKMTFQTKAVIPVHWGGYPADMDEIIHEARVWSSDVGCRVAVIEDACHALGATYKGRMIGSIGNFTCFSFQSIKHLTTGDGGCLCCRYDPDARRARALRWFGIDRSSSMPSILGEREFDITSIGYKFHMNDIAASIGLGNLEGFQWRLSCRWQNGQYYRVHLRDVPGVTLLTEDAHRSHAYWLFTMLVEEREDFIRAMKDRDIPVSVVHQGIQKYSVFGPAPDLPGQRRFDEEHICLPVHDGLTHEEIDSVVQAVKAGW